MADLQALKTELDTDPLARGYAGMDDGEATNSLVNVIDRERNRTSVTASEILNAVVIGEFAALTAAKQGEFWNLLARGDLNPFGVEATILINTFGGGSDTR